MVMERSTPSCRYQKGRKKSTKSTSKYSGATGSSMRGTTTTTRRKERERSSSLKATGRGTSNQDSPTAKESFIPTKTGVKLLAPGLTERLLDRIIDFIVKDISDVVLFPFAVSSPTRSYDYPIYDPVLASAALEAEIAVSRIRESRIEAAIAT